MRDDLARIQPALPGAIRFAREAFRNDGAEGETVWLLAEACELLLAAREQRLADDERARLAQSQTEHRVAQAHDEITRAVDGALTGTQESRLQRARSHLDAALEELRKTRTT